MSLGPGKLPPLDGPGLNLDYPVCLSPFVCAGQTGVLVNEESSYDA